jgi:hypothetical protein
MPPFKIKHNLNEQSSSWFNQGGRRVANNIAVQPSDDACGDRQHPTVHELGFIRLSPAMPETRQRIARRPGSR